MNAPFTPPLTDRELRWLRHIAVHGPQSSEFLMELCADTHRCRDTGLRTLQKLTDAGWLRKPPQQRQIAKADFNPHVYDLTKQAQLHLRGIGDPQTVPPTGHWWHAFLSASITSAIEIEAKRKEYGFIPAHEILGRNGASLGIPLGKERVIPDQLFALKCDDGFRSFVLEVDRGSEPHRSKTARKSVAKMVEAYGQLIEDGQARRHYGLKSRLLVLFVFTEPSRLAKCLDLIGQQSSALQDVAMVQSVGDGFPRFDDFQEAVMREWRRAGRDATAIL